MFGKLMSEGGLSLDRLQNFCDVAALRSLTKAAQGDPARSSLFSRQIKELEEFFQTELIRRTGRGIELTKVGEQLHVLAREQLLALSDFKGACTGRAIEITVASGDSQLQWLILERFEKILQKLPNMTFKLLSIPTTEIISRLREGTVDLSVVREGVATQPLKTFPLGVMSYSLFVPVKIMPNTGSIILRPKILSQFPIGILEGEGQFQHELQDLLKGFNISLNCKIQSFSFPLLARAVKLGLVAAILPSIAASDFKDADIKIFSPKFLDPLNRRTVLAWNPRIARVRPSVQKTVDVFREACRF